MNKETIKSIIKNERTFAYFEKYLNKNLYYYSYIKYGNPIKETYQIKFKIPISNIYYDQEFKNTIDDANILINYIDNY